MSLTIPRLKRALRQLRKLELALRFGSAAAPDHAPLLWDAFFSTKASGSQSVKYSLSYLSRLDRDEFKAALDEYLLRLYAQLAQDQTGAHVDIYDPRLLARFGLPAYAGSSEIKQRFRTLAKQYHPDLGGEQAQFVELVALYERLTGESH